jgi:hypothetical protein
VSDPFESGVIINNQPLEFIARVALVVFGIAILALVAWALKK